MKKFMIIGAVLAVVAFLAGAAGLAYAQSQSPNGGVFGMGSGQGFGPGMMGGRGGGMMGGGRGSMMSGYNGDGPMGQMHEYMFSALADALGLSVDDLQAQVDAGETPYEIAQAQGLSEEEVVTLFAAAQAAALDAAVADGVLTQEQADLMKTHMNGGMMGGYGFGGGRMMGGGRGGMMGGGRGGMMGYGSGNYGPMHAYMVAELAESLDLSAEDLQARIDAGETPYEVAQAEGLTEDEISALFTTAHTTALAQAVEAGVITQEQADWMSEHMGERGFGQGRGSGPCHGNNQP